MCALDGQGWELSRSDRQMSQYRKSAKDCRDLERSRKYMKVSSRLGLYFLTFGKSAKDPFDAKWC